MHSTEAIPKHVQGLFVFILLHTLVERYIKYNSFIFGKVFFALIASEVCVWSDDMNLPRRYSTRTYDYFNYYLVR